MHEQSQPEKYRQVCDVTLIITERLKLWGIDKFCEDMQARIIEEAEQEHYLGVEQSHEVTD